MASAAGGGGTVAGWARPNQGIPDAAGNFAPVLLLAVMVLGLGGVLLDSDPDEALTSGRRSVNAFLFGLRRQI